MTTVSDSSNFDLGRVPSATFAVLRDNFLNFLSLAVVLVGIPSLATSAFYVALIGASQPATLDPGALATKGLLATASWLVGIVGAFLLQAAVVTGAISDLNGRKIDVGAMISGRLRLVPVLLGLAIAQGFAEAVGFMLLLVPGMMLATAWAVTVPAVVIEKSGVFGAFSRSADLTRGHRWGVFGLGVAYLIGVFVLGAAVRGVFFGASGVFPIGASALAQMGSLGMLCFNAAFKALAGMIGAAGVAVIYYELRRAREGVAPQALIDTFS